MIDELPDDYMMSDDSIETTPEEVQEIQTEESAEGIVE